MAFALEVAGVPSKEAEQLDPVLLTAIQDALCLSPKLAPEQLIAEANTLMGYAPEGSLFEQALQLATGLLGTGEISYPCLATAS